MRDGERETERIEYNQTLIEKTKGHKDIQEESPQERKQTTSNPVK